MRFLPPVISLFFFVSCASQTVNHSIESINEIPPQMSQFRFDKLSQLVGYGIVEFAWEDDAGAHRQQGDFDFWRNGSQISWRISKLGELIFWFGADASGNWSFDFTDDISSLRINHSDAFFADAESALCLMGLSDLPDARPMSMLNDANAKTIIDKKNRQWEVSFVAGGSSIEEIQMTADDFVVSSKFTGLIAVEKDGRHQLYWEKTPKQIDTVSSRNNAKVKIVFAGLSTVVSEEPFNLVFDVDKLREILAPNQVFFGPE